MGAFLFFPIPSSSPAPVAAQVVPLEAHKDFNGITVIGEPLKHNLYADLDRLTEYKLPKKQCEEMKDVTLYLKQTITKMKSLCKYLEAKVPHIKQLLVEQLPKDWPKLKGFHFFTKAYPRLIDQQATFHIEIFQPF